MNEGGAMWEVGEGNGKGWEVFGVSHLEGSSTSVCVKLTKLRVPGGEGGVREEGVNKRGGSGQE